MLLLFPHFCGNMSAPRAIENEPMGVPDDAELKTPPAKRRGGVLSLSMGAAPRSGTTPASAEVHDVATPRQGRASSVSARKRRGATVDTLRTLSAAPASISPPPMMSPGPDASMEELRAFCVTMLAQHDKALVEIVEHSKAERLADAKVALFSSLRVSTHPSSLGRRASMRSSTPSSPSRSRMLTPNSGPT